MIGQLFPSETQFLPDELQASLDAMPEATALVMLKPGAMRAVEGLLWNYIGNPAKEAPKSFERVDSQGLIRQYGSDAEVFVSGNGQLVYMCQSSPKTYDNPRDNYFAVVANLNDYTFTELKAKDITRGRISGGPLFAEFTFVPRQPDTQPVLTTAALAGTDAYLQQRLMGQFDSDNSAVRLLFTGDRRQVLINPDGEKHELTTVNVLDIKAEADSFYAKFGSLLTQLAFEDYLASTLPASPAATVAA